MENNDKCFLCNLDCQSETGLDDPKIYNCDRCGKYKVTGRGQAISKEYFKGLYHILSGIARNLTEDRLEPLLITSTDPKELIKNLIFQKQLKIK
jgi:hypothetical protein